MSKILLTAIEKLEDEVFNGKQKYERRVAIYINYLLTSPALSIDKQRVSAHLPSVLRNIPVNLKDTGISENIFPFLTGIDETELDLIFLNVPSFFGHKTPVTYHVEIEMHRRDAHALQKLIDFTTFCNKKRIFIAPILVTNRIRARTRLHQNVLTLKLELLEKMGNNGLKFILTPDDIPGLAYDDAATCLFILDILSEKPKMTNREALEKIESNTQLRRKIFDLCSFASDTTIEKSLKTEDITTFRRRMTGKDGYFSKLKEHNLIESTVDNKLKLTLSGSRLQVEWRAKELV